MTLLQAKHIIKKFSSQKAPWKALDNICLEVKKGEIFGIIGSSGAGKSTLMKCLSSLDSNFSGDVRLEGESFPFHDPAALKAKRKKIGMIFQHYYLLESRTVKENIALPLELHNIPSFQRKLRVKELLQKVGLSHKKDCYPSTLSGGEKQRVAIARALACEPSILFCDEATSALDPKTTKEILGLLKQLNQELSLTLVLITHEMDVIRSLCHKVAVMDQGEIIEQGTVLEVFSSPKHPITQLLIQNSPHEMDSSSLKKADPSLLFVTLHFRGEVTQKPILSHLISQLKIEVNILSGWIDTLEGTSIGSLTVALKGDQIEQALAFFHQNHILYEVLS